MKSPRYHGMQGQAHGSKQPETLLRRSMPVLGLIAVGFGMLANLPWLGLLGVVGIVLGVIALVKKQFLSGFAAVMLSMFALITSPLLWLTGGLYMAHAWLDIAQENGGVYPNAAPQQAQPGQLAPPNGGNEKTNPTLMLDL